MTKDQARAEAEALVSLTGRAAHVWEHVGGQTPKGMVVAQQRYLARDSAQPDPKWVWRKVETVEP